MQYSSWVAVFALSTVLGVLAVRYMTVVPLSMVWYALLVVAVAVLLIVLIGRSFVRFQIVLAVLVALVGFVGGWLLTNAWFLGQEEARALPAINPPPAEQRDHLAVLYFTHGEPPRYDPHPWIETFREFDHSRAEFIPVPFRPFFFLQFRGKYLELGGSPHNIMHGEMRNSLERMFRAAGDTRTRFYTAFLDSNPRPDESVIRAINEGANKIIVANVFVTISSHTEAGQEYIKALDIEERYGIPVCYSQPLWDSPALKQMFVERVNRNLNGTDKAQVGVLLVGHGQPVAWDKLWPTQTSQEQSFREDITQLLIADGYRAENIASAWMEFQPPHADEVAPQLAANGVKKIFVFATSISASSLHSLYDIPEAVRSAKLPAGVEIVNLGAWDNDPLVIQAIYDEIQRCP